MPEYQTSSGWGINNHGEVVGQVVARDPDDGINRPFAFKWHPTEGLRIFSDVSIDDYGKPSIAYDISETGQIVGEIGGQSTVQYVTGSKVQFPVVHANGWSYSPSRGHWVWLPFSGGPTRTFAANNVEEEVGLFFFGSRTIGFLEHWAGPMAVLLDKMLVALDVNNHSEVVGAYNDDAGQARALYVNVGEALRSGSPIQLTELNDVVDFARVRQHITRLSVANSINDAGQIVGYGISPLYGSVATGYSGSFVPYVLTPVTP